MKRGRERRWPWRPTLYARKGGKSEVVPLSIITPVSTSGLAHLFPGEAGLHTAMQPHAFGVVFVIKTDGREVFRSLAIRGPTKHSYTVDVTGGKTLELIVENASDRNGGNWGLWLDPVLSR